MDDQIGAVYGEEHTEEYVYEYDEEPARRRRAHPALKAGLVAVVLGIVSVGGLGVYNLASAIEGGSHPGAASGTSHSSPPSADGAPPTAAQAAAVEQAFLADWAKGDLTAAGALTDGPSGAVTALTSFQGTLQPSSLVFVPSGPLATQSGVTPTAPGRLTLGFKATVTFAGASAAWTYDGQVGVQRGSDGRALVHWAPSVIHPQLGPSQSLAIRPVAAPASATTDRKGRPLDGFPSLTSLLAALQPPAAPGSSAGAAASAPPRARPW